MHPFSNQTPFAKHSNKENNPRQNKDKNYLTKLPFVNLAKIKKPNPAENTLDPVFLKK
jgi:hypothetical protein